MFTCVCVSEQKEKEKRHSRGLYEAGKTTMDGLDGKRYEDRGRFVSGGKVKARRLMVRSVFFFCRKSTRNFYTMVTRWLLQHSYFINISPGTKKKRKKNQLEDLPSRRSLRM